MQHQKQDAMKTLQGLLSYLRQDPNNDKLRVSVFEAALAAGEFPEANFQLVHARHLRPDDKSWRHREALLQLAQGKFANAQATLERLIEEGCDEPALGYNLAYALFGQGACDRARDLVAPFRASHGNLGQLAWALWLRCEHRLARLEEALEAFSAAPGAPSAEACGVASLIALDANRSGEADRWSQQALARSPDQLEALVTRGTLALGRQDIATATTLFERALQLSPKDGRAWSGLAFTRLLQADLPSARAAFQTAVDGMPDHIGTWLGFGWCEFLQGDVAAARRTFEKALDLDRNFGESHGSLAVALVRLNAREQAEREVEIALRLDRRSLSARYAEAMLNGEVDDPQAFRRLARRVLGQYSVSGESGEERSLADLVLPPET